MANEAAAVSEQVLQFIKNTCLDFKITETPFSLDIQIKKKFIIYNSGSGSQLQSTSSKPPHDVCIQPSHSLSSIPSASAINPIHMSGGGGAGLDMDCRC